MNNSDDNMDISKIIDDMEPFEFRIKKGQDFSVYTLPLTKMNEQYLLIKQVDKQRNSSVHYYIIDDGTKVIGRFDIGYDLSTAGITYHIIDEFQNKGIGQIVLSFVVDNLFEEYKVERLIILPINDRSKNIALKSGFSKKTERIYELNMSEYLKSKSEENELDER